MNPEINDLNGLVAVVTGGNSGIGEGVCRTFAALGMKVVVAGRNRERCNQVVSAIQEKGGEAMAIACDVANLAQVESLMAETQRVWGGVDVLVANAGIGAKQLGLAGNQDNLRELPGEKWQQLMDTNLNGAYYCAHAAFRQMVERGSGHIIYLASQAAGWPRDAIAYGVSKSAMAVLGLHTHYEGLKIRQRINPEARLYSHVICPGLVDTPWFEGSNIPKEKFLSTEHIAELITCLLREPEKPRKYFEAMSKTKDYCVGPISSVVEMHDIILRIYKDPFDV